MWIEIVVLITIIIVFVVANIIPAENATNSYYNVNLNNVHLCNKSCVCCSQSSYLYLFRGILMLEFLFCPCPLLMSHSKWFIVNHMCTYGISCWNFQHYRLRDDNCHSVVVYSFLLEHLQYSLNLNAPAHTSCSWSNWMNKHILILNECSFPIPWYT